MGKTATHFFLKYALGAFGSACLALITIPFLTRIMSPSEYGKGMMYITLISLLFYLCSCGMDQAFVRFYFKAKNDQARVNHLYSCFAVIFLFLIPIIFIFTFLYQPLLEFFFSEESLSLYLVIITGVIAYLLNRLILLSIEMQQKASLYALGQFMGQCSYMLALFFGYFFIHQSNFKLIIYAEIFSLFFSFFLLLIWDRHHWDPSALKAQYALKWKDIMENFCYGWPFIFTFILFWAFESIDRIMLLKWSNYLEVGLYSAAFSLAAPLYMLETLLSTTWTPIASQSVSNQPFKSKKLFYDTFRTLLFLMLFVSLMLINSSQLIIYFLGPHYREAIRIFEWLLFIPLFSLLSEIVIVGNFLTTKSKFNVLIAAVSVITNLFFCYWLIPIFGATGAAISLALTYFVFFFARLFFSFKYYAFKIVWLKFAVGLLLLIASILSPTFLGNYNILGRIIIDLILLLCFRSELYFVIKKYPPKKITWLFQKN